MPRTRQPDPNIPANSFNNSFIDLIPNFSGDLKISVKTFITKINDVGNLNKWSEEDKVRVARLKLCDAAEEIFQNEESRNVTFEQFSSILKNKFERKVPLATMLQDLALCAQLDSESVSEFATKIRKLGRQIFGNNFSSDNDNLIQARFVAGLKPELQRYVLLRSPQNFEQSVEIAINEESNCRLVQHSIRMRDNFQSSDGANSNAVNILKEQIELLTEKVQNLSTQVSINNVGAAHNRGRPKQRLTCFYCGKAGHIKTHCRKRLRDEGERRERSNSRNRVRFSRGQNQYYRHNSRERNSGRDNREGRTSPHNNNDRNSSFDRERSDQENRYGRRQS